MLDQAKLKLNGLAGRYGDSAPVVCCGVCKPCVTTAATGFVAGLAVVAVQKVKGNASPQNERQGRER